MGQACCKTQRILEGFHFQHHHDENPQNQMIDKIQMTVESQHPHMSKYQETETNVFRKILTSWQHLPFRKPLKWDKQQYFRIEILDVMNNNLLIGIINDKSYFLRKPWTTGGVICLETHQKKGSSSCFVEGKGEKLDALLQFRKGDHVAVRVRKNIITWEVNEVIVKEVIIPEEFAKVDVFPYVSLWHCNDSIRVLKS